MNKNLTVWLGLVVAIFIGVGFYMYNLAKIDDISNSEMEKNEEFMLDDSSMDDAMMDEESVGTGEMMDDVMMEEGEGVGSYETYSADKLSRAEDGKIVLFFRAFWCPTCRALDLDIKESLSDIPSGVSILDVDYDNSTILKRKYGVTYQHTMVQVDSDGNLIKKWPGGSNLESVINEII